MRNYGILCSFNVWFALQAMHYEILKIPSTATESEIRKAYLRQAKIIHPDRSLDENAVRKFQALGNAYRTLNDPDLRKEYDASLQNENLEPDIPINCDDCSCLDITWFGQCASFFFAPCLRNFGPPKK